MKQKITIFLILVLTVSLTSIFWGCFIFIIKIGWRLSDPRLMVTADSMRGNNIYLYQSGFQDRDVSLCIPLLNDPNKIRRITSWRYPEFKVLWSKDNSVIAIELNDYFIAYDFDTEKLIEYNPYRTGTQSASEEKSIDNQIEALINNRGGIGNIVACTYNTYVEMTYKDWQEFCKGLKAGEQDSQVKSP